MVGDAPGLNRAGTAAEETAQLQQICAVRQGELLEIISCTYVAVQPDDRGALLAKKRDRGRQCRLNNSIATKRCNRGSLCDILDSVPAGQFRDEEIGLDDWTEVLVPPPQLSQFPSVLDVRRTKFVEFHLEPG